MYFHIYRTKFPYFNGWIYYLSKEVKYEETEVRKNY